jgi:hypothetical protein
MCITVLPAIPMVHCLHAVAVDVVLLPSLIIHPNEFKKHSQLSLWLHSKIKFRFIQACYSSHYMIYNSFVFIPTYYHIFLH